jgi:hypothetical protein
VYRAEQGGAASAALICPVPRHRSYYIEERPTMCCLVQIAMLVMGVIAIVKGQIKLSPRRVVDGVPARVIGVVLIMPLPLALFLGFVVGFGLAAQGKNVDRNTMLIVSPIDIGVVVLALVISLIIGLATSHPVEKRRRREEYDDYDDDDERPRRRRRRIYEEENDEDEDDVPRRKRARRVDDEDDEDDRRIMRKD